MLRFLYFIVSILAVPFACWAFLEDELSRSVDVKPGGEYTYRLRLCNSEGTPLVVHLTQTDYAYEASGDTHFPPPGTFERSNARWIHLPDSQVVIPPHTAKDLFYTVRVPRSSSLSGSYWSVILVEPEQSHTISEEEATIHVKVRYAHQIVTNVEGGKAQLKLVEVAVDQSQELSRLFLDVENVGDYFLQPACSLKIYDAKGNLASDIHIPEQNILPGSSIRYVIEIDDLASQDYYGLLLLRDGERYFGEKFTFQVPP